MQQQNGWRLHEEKLSYFFFFSTHFIFERDAA
jgi:hypothetical protein